MIPLQELMKRQPGQSVTNITLNFQIASKNVFFVTGQKHNANSGGWLKGTKGRKNHLCMHFAYIISFDSHYKSLVMML